MPAFRILLLAVALWSATTAAGPPSGHQRYALALEGQATGALDVDQVERGDDSVVQFSRTVHLLQLHQRSSIEERTEIVRHADGRLSTIDFRSRAGTSDVQWQAQLHEDTLQIHSTAPVAGRETRVQLPAGTIFPDQEVARLRGLLGGAAQTEQYPLFDPAQQQVGWMQARVLSASDPTLAAVRVHAKGSGTADDRVFWFDRDGALIRLEGRYSGFAMTLTACAVECDDHAGTPFDPMALMVVRSPYRIPASAAQRSIRYVISRSDGQPPRLAASIEQAVSYVGTTAVVTVCGDCGMAQAPDAAELALYSRPNDWVQSDDAEIRRLALYGGRASRPVAQRMHDLEQRVRISMKGAVELTGYGDARSALKSGSGDCTEFALLLAALARAQGIPARLVFGMAYADRFSGKKDVFSPHAWVQAWDGTRWTSYDAALNGFDSTHIALAIGSGDPAEIAADFNQLRWLRVEKVGVIRATVPRADSSTATATPSSG